MLVKEKLPHEVLNAKNHEREAEIVAKAGEIGAITLSTNMAGRGTDIKLAEGVRELGGLAVLGTERFESRRIDNQLRGRAGRQGDPGYSRFFISTEDDLIQRFGGDTFKNRLALCIRWMSDDENAPLENKMLTKLVTMAQTKIEGINFDSRKNVLKYDDVIRKQREIFYAQRTQVIKAEKLDEVLKTLMKSAIADVVDQFMESAKFDDDKLAQTFNEKLFRPNMVDVNVIREYEDDSDIIEYLYKIACNDLDNRITQMREILGGVIPEEVKKENPNIIEDTVMFQLKRIILPILDRNWREHIDDMAGFRQGIHLQSYAQNNPLELYQREGFNKFERLTKRINNEVLIAAMHTTIAVQRRIVEPPKEEDALKGLSTNQDQNTVKKNTPKRAEPKAGANDPCPCGSGLKYKFCHGVRR